MKEYKYVKFSGDTAKINPEMIIREYEDLIEKNSITTYNSIMDIFRGKIEKRFNLGSWDQKYQLLDNKQKKKIAEELISNGASIYKKLNILPIIKKEFKQFKKEFKRFIK